MPVKERLIEFIKYKQLNNSEFGRSIGVSSAFVSSMVKSIQPDKIQRITLAYPELNISWLLTGKGDMIKKEHQPVDDNNISEEMIPISVIRMMDEERKRHERRLDEVIRQNGILIETIREQSELLKKTNLHQEDNATCADVGGLDLGV